MKRLMHSLWTNRWITLLLGVLLLPADLAAQRGVIGVMNNFVIPEYDSQTKKKRAVIYAGKAQPGPKDTWQIEKLKIESYSEDDKVAWVVQAPTCTYNYIDKTASSPDPLEARSADGKLIITGEGFFWNHAEQQLVISNQVRTLTQKGESGEKTNVIGMARQNLELTATSFYFNMREFQAVYTGQAAAREILPPGATNAPLTLDCGQLKIKMLKGGGLDSVLAETNVVFTQGPNQVKGESGKYLAASETIEVTRNAAWETATAMGTGEVLVMDRKNNSFKATGKTTTRLKNASLDKAIANQPGEADAREPIDIRADSIAAQLPTALAPESRIEALGNVSIQQGDRKTSGDRATYLGSTTNGQMEITGHAQWQTAEAEGKADSLVLDSLRNEFSGRGNGYVKLHRPKSVVSTPAPEASMEIWADRYDLKSDQTFLTGGVRMHQSEWKLKCSEIRLINAPGTNRIERAIARDAVEAEQILPPNSSGAPWRLTCRQMQFGMAANGRQIDSISAEEQVVIEPVPAMGAKSPPEPAWRLSCEQAAAKLAPDGKRIETIEARRSVVIEPSPAAGATPAINSSWRLKCDEMSAKLALDGNRIDTVDARENIVIEQTDLANLSGAPSIWRLNCERGRLKLKEAGGLMIEDAQVQGRVRITQEAAGSPQPVWAVTSDQASMKMTSRNQIHQMTAQDNVHVIYAPTNAPSATWQMWGGKAAMTMAESNRIGQVTAHEKVHVLYASTNTSVPPWRLWSENAMMTLGNSNTIQKISASNNVRIEQGKTTNAAALKLLCQEAFMSLAESNTMQSITAQKQVEIEYGASLARGGEAILDNGSNEVLLRDHPWLLFTDERTLLPGQSARQVEIQGANTLTWNRASNQFKVKGPYRLIPKIPLKQLKP